MYEPGPPNLQCSAFYVCNPVTKQWAPPPPSTSGNGIEGLGFISRVKHGIPSYRVVLITGGSNTYNRCSRKYCAISLVDILHFHTFSPETGKWRVSKVLLSNIYDIQTHLWPSTPYNGVIHWVDQRLKTVIAYDPYKISNPCRLIHLPSELNVIGGMNGVFGVTRGRLRYFEICETYMDEDLRFPSWKLHVLEDYENGRWYLEHSAETRRVCSDGGALSGILKKDYGLVPLAFHPYLEDIVYFRHMDYILTFNIKTGRYEDEHSFVPDVDLPITWRQVFPIVVQPSPTPIPEPCW